MTKVVHIITRLDFGGAQGNTLYTAARLDRSRFDALIVAGRGGQLEGKAGPCRLLFAESLVRPVSPLKDLAAFFELRALLKKMKSGDPVAVQVERAGRLRFISFELP